MQRRAALILLTAIFSASCARAVSSPGPTIEAAFNKHLSDLRVTGEGTVDRVLSDDREGSPHQRFIVRLASGHTILVEHNIDVAPRVSDLKPGDAVAFSGEYVWNQQGGLIHWTHHDPSGNHTPGWIKHGGRTYE